MAHKFQIIGEALVVTNTVTSKDLIDLPKSDLYYNLDELEKSLTIRLIDVSGKNSILFGAHGFPLANSIDSTNTPFTEASFKIFARNNLGFKTTPGGSGVNIDGGTIS